MAIIAYAQQAGVYRVAARFAERGLARDGSLYNGDRVWTPTALADLGGRLERGLAAAGSTFAERWDAVLSDAPEGVCRLAAEVLHVHALFPADLAGATKRRLVHTTLDRLDAPPLIAAWIDAALDGGVAGTGVAYKTLRLSQIGFLVRAGLAWKARPARGRRDTLADASLFKAWLHGLPARGGQPQREALLHLIHPAAFEPIVSATVKRLLVDAFATHVPEGVTDDDEALRIIRDALAAEHGAGFSFVDPPLAARWGGRQ